MTIKLVARLENMNSSPTQKQTTMTKITL